MAATKPAIELPQLQPTRATNEWLPRFTPSTEIARAATPDGTTQPGYYGVPLLKPPTWRWEIALYFHLEGVSSGAAMASSLAELFGGKRLRPIARAGRYAAFASFLPCPPLLIKDLGDPKRFLHMLRVFKPSSPMNFGSWALTGYSLPLVLLAAKQTASDLPLKYWPLKVAGALLPARFLSALEIPFALAMASYPGVLLSMTSTPLWTKSRFLGPLFVASSIGAGAAATTMAMTVRGESNRASLKRLEQIQTAAHACETAALAGYLMQTGRAAKPLVTGRQGWKFWLGAVGAGLAAPTILRATQKKPRRRTTLLTSALTLAGSLALKWAVTHAGRASAEDIRATHDATRPSSTAPGWS